MAGLQEYKCPCCGGAIAFDSKIQKMKCPYCDTEFEMDALKGYDAELQNEQTDDMEWDTSVGCHIPIMIFHADQKYCSILVRSITIFMRLVESFRIIRYRQSIQCIGCGNRHIYLLSRTDLI